MHKHQRHRLRLTVGSNDPRLMIIDRLSLQNNWLLFLEPADDSGLEVWGQNTQSPKSPNSQQQEQQVNSQGPSS
jgi:hypothetical protein